MELDTNAVEDMTLGQLRKLVGPVSLEYAPVTKRPKYLRVSWHPKGYLCNLVLRDGAFLYFTRRLVQENPFPMDSNLINDVIHYEATKFVGMVFLNISRHQSHESMTLKELGQTLWS